MAHLPDGRVVFVPFSAPGDRIRARITQQQSRFARARVETLTVPGPDRVDPVCPVFGSCGGCAWQHVAYEAQLAAKVRIVEDALVRLGRIPFAEPIGITASPESYGYRTRTRVLRERARVGYRRLASRAIVPVTRCPVLTPDLDRALHDLALRTDAKDGEWEIAAGRDGVHTVALGAAADATGGVELDVEGDAIRVSPGVFFQANAGLHDALAKAVFDAAGSGDHALEIFSGAGFFTLGLARRFDRVTAVESHDVAVADLRFNLARAGRTNALVVAERLESVQEQLPSADVLVLDPPRTGLPRGAATALAALAPARIVYLSCDPATLARDLGDFTAARYRLVRVQAFDLFPQTPHVEALALLVPADGPPADGLVHSGTAPRSGGG